MNGDGQKTRSDLIQVEYALYSDMLRERRADRQEESDEYAARLLDVESVEDLTGFGEAASASDVDAVRWVIGTLLDGIDPDRVKGAHPWKPPTWEIFELGDRNVRVPTRVSVHFLPGEAGEVPLYFRTWPQHGGLSQYLHVFARAVDADQAERFIPGIIEAARSTSSPYHRRIVDARMAGGGVHLRVIPTPSETRASLVFQEEVWEAVTRNVDRMFERMHTLEAAGLGGNRGLLLAGPPGTGKTALCRALAAEYEGRATVVIVSASVGSYLLGELYERLNSLRPALVLVEDLDLIVGDREDRARAGLVQFLTVLDGLMTRHSGVVTIATTNDPSAIDEAATRAARFDQVVYLGLPGLPARRAILALYLAHLDHEADLDELARMTDGLSGADLREIVRSSVLDAESEAVRHTDLVVATERLLEASGGTAG